jgi:hypothetical protein
MKRASLALAVFALLAAPAAFACDHDRSHATFHMTDWEGPVRWAERYDPSEAHLAITSRNGKATLLITDQVVAMQLSDRAFRKIQRKLRAEWDAEEDHVLARAIKTAVIKGVTALLDHSAECSIDDLRDVDYRHGRLVIVTEDGDRLFDEVEVEDEDVTSAFSERDARAFVREFRRLKSRRG